MTKKEQQEEQKQEVALWTPAKFEGSDLLPVDLAATVDGQAVDRTGRENISSEDLILPSLGLLQGMSDAVTQGHVEDARPGKFILSSTQEVLEPPLRLLLCAHTKSRALFPKGDNPRYAGKETCISRDGIQGSRYGSCDSCPHKEWGEKNQAPLCSESHNFTAITPFGPAVIRFARSSIKSARQFLTTWQMSPKSLWRHPVMVAVTQHSKKLPTGKDATYFSMDMRWLQKEAVPPAIQEVAKALHQQVMQAHESGRFRTEDEDRDAEPAY